MVNHGDMIVHGVVNYDGNVFQNKMLYNRLKIDRKLSLFL